MDYTLHFHMMWHALDHWSIRVIIVYSGSDSSGSQAKAFCITCYPILFHRKCHALNLRPSACRTGTLQFCYGPAQPLCIGDGAFWLTTVLKYAVFGKRLLTQLFTAVLIYPLPTFFWFRGLFLCHLPQAEVGNHLMGLKWSKKNCIFQSQ